MKTENRSQYEALGNNYRVCGVYSPEPRVEVYCVKLNFNISKNWFILGYLCAFVHCQEIRRFFSRYPAGADTGGVDRVDIHPPFFSKKKFEMSLYLK